MKSPMQTRPLPSVSYRKDYKAKNISQLKADSPICFGEVVAVIIQRMESRSFRGDKPRRRN